MTTLNKQTSRRKAADETKIISQKTEVSRTGKKGDTRSVPFRGSLHAEHPQDPFRNVFGDSRLKFEF